VSAVIGPFEAIQYVGTPLALIAFVAAILAWVYRARLAERRKLIETAPAEERAELLVATIRDFSTVPLENLTREQRYQLAVRLIDERRSRFRLAALVAVLAAVTLAVAVVVLARDEAATGLVVRLHGPGGPQDLVTEGTVILDAGDLRRGSPVGPDGQARFEGLARSAFADGLTVTATAPGLVPAAAVRLPALPDGGAISLAMKRAPTSVRGTVLDAPGTRRPVAGVVVNFASGAAVATTDALGNFQTTVDRPPGSRVPVQLVHRGQVGFDDAVTLSAEEPLVLYFDAGHPR